MSSTGSGSGSSGAGPGQAGDIVVTGIGMRTAVGNDTEQTCATVRTGLSRFAEWPYMGIGLEEAGVAVAALDPELGDATWAEKWLAMAQQPVHEALWQAGLHDGARWRHQFGDVAKLGAWLAIPAPGRNGLEDGVEEEFARVVGELCVSPARADAVQLVAMDHAAGLVAVGRAMQALLEGLVKIAVVIGVDSHLSSPWLEELDDRGILKYQQRGLGIIPGEAAGVVVLERRADAQRRKAEPLLSLGMLAIDREEIPIGPAHPIVASGLSRVVKKCLSTRPDKANVSRIITDLNGERWRALEWGLVETRCLSKLAPGWQLWHPADSYGDVGAAGGVLSLGIAARAFERGYGGSGSMLITSASTTGERAAVMVAPHDQTA
jgi:3-oxoacyl-[acyl-carrier-protein] synthase-1